MNYCNPEGFRNEIKELLARGDIDAFYNWFDGGERKEGAFKKGADVFNRVIFPFANKYIGDRLKNEPIALDLGYGAGTKIQAALNFFSKVYGVDVHEEIVSVLEELHPTGEIDLLTSDGHTIPVGKNKIDFLYSWVTFCHIGTIKNVEMYLKEIHRVLKPGSVAVLFFTRLIRSGKNQTWAEVEADMKKELAHPTGYREGGPKSRVRTINLVISMRTMEELSEAAKFQILERTASWDDTPTGKIYHGQYGIVLRKPVPKKKAKATTKTKGLKKPAATLIRRKKR